MYQANELLKQGEEAGEMLDLVRFEAVHDKHLEMGTTLQRMERLDAMQKAAAAYEQLVSDHFNQLAGEVTVFVANKKGDIKRRLKKIGDVIDRGLGVILEMSKVKQKVEASTELSDRVSHRCFRCKCIQTEY
jgi:4-aminobutyrate aminotransferase-like enzyme